jgi:hypothetical protein
VQELDVHELDTQELDTTGSDTTGSDTTGLDTTQLDTLEPDTADDGSSGRHRAPASTARRVSFRLALAALGVLLATGLGALAADLVGLTDTGPSSLGAPLPIVARNPVDEPRPARTTGLTTGQVPSDPGADVPLADPSPALQPRAADDSAPTQAAVTPSPVTVPTVRTGSPCAAVGQRGVTARGDAVVCTASPGKGPNKWRAA